MPVRVIARRDEFDALRPLWNEWAGGAAFRRWEWAASALDGYGDKFQLHALAVDDAHGRLIGVAPWGRDRSWRRGRCLAFLGGRQTCGDDLSLLAYPGKELEFVGELAAWLLGPAGRDAWDWLCLDGVTQGDPLVTALAAQLEAAGRPVLKRDDASRWAIALPGAWDHYAATLGRNTRGLARRCQRRLQSRDDGLELVAPQSRTECDEFFDVIAALHQRRWQAEGGAGCFASAEFEQCLRAAVHRWYGAGDLRMRLLRANGKPLVGVIAVARGGTLSTYLSGRDPDADVKHSGWLMSFALIEEAISQGLSTFDMMRGDEPYKALLGGTPIAQVRHEIAGRGAFNRARALAEQGRAAVRKYAAQHAAAGEGESGSASDQVD